MSGVAVTVLAWVCSLGAVATAFLVFRVSSMARATYALLASFAFVGVDLALLRLSYLGVVVVLMMVMEMAVMAVFMLLYMMNPAGLMPMQMYHNKSGAMTISVGSFVLLGGGALLVPWPERAGEVPADPTLQLGRSIMGPTMLVMMVVGVSLFATIVAAVVLATDRGRYDRYGDDLDADAPNDPVPGGVGR